MASVIKVNQIQDTAGTVLMDNEPCVDLWRLTANFTTDAATVTGWARPSESYTSSINGLTESSGIFTFTKTGLYQVTCVFHSNAGSSADNSHGLNLDFSTNSGSSYTTAALGRNGDVDTGSNNGSTVIANINVTDVSTFRVKLTTSSMISGTYINGSSNSNFTSVSFIKLAPAQ